MRTGVRGIHLIEDAVRIAVAGAVFLLVSSEGGTASSDYPWAVSALTIGEVHVLFGGSFALAGFEQAHYGFLSLLEYSDITINYLYVLVNTGDDAYGTP